VICNALQVTGWEVNRFRGGNTKSRAMDMDLERSVPVVSRWPREVLVPRKNSDGYDIQFQVSKTQMPSPEVGAEPENDLSDIVAEFEAMFAIKYPHILASPRKRQIL
jgi:hypothetical protein